MIIRKTFHSSFRYWQILDATFLLRDALRRIISTPEDESLFCAICKWQSLIPCWASFLALVEDIHFFSTRGVNEENRSLKLMWYRSFLDRFSFSTPIKSSCSKSTSCSASWAEYSFLRRTETRVCCLKFPTYSFLNNFRDNFNVSMQRWTVERNSFSRWNSLSLWRSTGMSKEMMLCPTSTGFSKPFKNSMKSRRAAWTFTVSTLWPLQNIWLSLEENRIPVTLLAASDILFLGTTYLFMTAVPHTADNCTISEVLSRPVVSKSKWTKLSVPLRVGLEGMMQFSSSVIGELNSMFSE